MGPHTPKYTKRGPFQGTAVRYKPGQYFLEKMYSVRGDPARRGYSNVAGTSGSRSLALTVASTATANIAGPARARAPRRFQESSVQGGWSCNPFHVSLLSLLAEQEMGDMGATAPAWPLRGRAGGGVAMLTVWRPPRESCPPQSSSSASSS